MSAAVPTPLLRVGCGAQCGRSTSGGHLIIEPGAVRFELHAAAVELGLPSVIRGQPPLVFERMTRLSIGVPEGAKGAPSMAREPVVG